MFISPIAARHKPRIRGASIPPPVGGLNARDELANMDERDALILTNYIPDAGSVNLRNGFTEHVTGISGAVGALLEWRGPSSAKLFAANAANIYDVTSAGAVGAAVVSSLTSSDWSSVMMATSGGNFMVIANGADTVRHYNGSVWAAPSITGVTSSTLNHVWSHKRRLWFVEEASTSVWYLPVDSVSGAATELDVGPLLSLGGHVVSGTSWTLDGGSGMDDYMAIISSAGQVVIYQGTDPASSSTWSLVGVFRLAAPLSKRCFTAVGDDVAVLTIEGIVSLHGALSLDRSAQSKASVTDKINRLFFEAATSYGDVAGWSVFTYPSGGYLMVNIPMTTTTSFQYVMNSETGGWCKFTGMNASAWSLFNDNLYFAASGVIYLADDGTDDDGAAIAGDIKTAFNYFGDRGRLKQFHMIRPIITATGIVTPAIQLNFDYGDEAPTNVPLTSFGDGATWDVSIWDVDVWGGAETTSAIWGASFGLGYCAAVRMRTLSTGVSIKVNAFDVTTQPGAIGI